MGKYKDLIDCSVNEDSFPDTWTSVCSNHHSDKLVMITITDMKKSLSIGGVHPNARISHHVLPDRQH